MAASFVAAAALTIAGLVVAQQTASGAGAPILPTIYVTYATNCTFTVTDDSRKAVTTIAPGTYQVNITTPESFGSIDLSGSASTDMTACKGYVQFELTGPGVDLTTTLDDGDSSFNQFSDVVFRKSSTYVVQDNNQPTVARATITIASTGVPVVPLAPSTSTSVKSTTTTTATKQKKKTPAIAPVRGTLAGAVTVGGKVTLKDRTGAITSVTSGRYTITVTDRNKQRGFVLQQIRKPAQTISSKSFVGRRSITLDLKPGEWFFYPTPASGSLAPRKSFFIAVAN